MGNEFQIQVSYKMEVLKPVSYLELLSQTQHSTYKSNDQQKVMDELDDIMRRTRNELSMMGTDFSATNLRCEDPLHLRLDCSHRVDREGYTWRLTLRRCGQEVGSGRTLIRQSLDLTLVDFYPQGADRLIEKEVRRTEEMWNSVLSLFTQRFQLRLSS